MRFIKYQIIEHINAKNTKKALRGLDIKKTLSKLNNSGIETDRIGQFAIANCIHENNILVGNLSQSYNISLIKFEGTSKLQIPIPENSANDDRTYFFINCSEGQIYIQNRKYAPQELSPNLTVIRMQTILHKYLAEDKNILTLEKVNIDYDISQMQTYFRESFVKSVEFHNVANFKLADKTQLHNPREDLDSAAIESWNYYSSDTVDSIKVTAKKNKSIAKNPIANIGIKLAEQNTENYDKILKGITVIEDGQDFTVKPKGNNYLVIPINDDKNFPCAKILQKTLYYLLKKKL